MLASVVGLSREPRSFVWMRRCLGLLITIALIDGAISSYRAWVQVYTLSIATDESVLAPGATIQVRVVTSGRTLVQLRVELIQSSATEALLIHDVEPHDDPGLDPRARRVGLTAAVPMALWCRFHQGPALLRVTAMGRPQWLRTPPPTVRELSVTLQ